jgi:hypothetical protein
LIAMVSLGIFVMPSAAFASEPSSSAKTAIPLSGCYVNGKLLAGKVQVVTTSLGRATDRIPTFKVQVVSSFPNLKVQIVNSFPDKCGKWKFVNSFPDFKIRYVNSFPDFKIKMVNSFPGL